MRKLFYAFLALTAGLAIASCAKEYDDSALQEKVGALDKKVTALEQKVNSLTEQVTGLSTTIKEWQDKGFVEDGYPKETPEKDGWIIKFVGGKEVVLYRGKDGAAGKDGNDGAAGADGKTPEIIEQDGALVWAIDGQPILVDGKPVPANVVPTFQVKEDGHLWMTLSGKEIDLGNVKGEKGEDGTSGAGGDCILKSIELSEDGENVIFTLTNDTTYEIPLAKAFKLVIEKLEQEVKAGATVKVPFTVQNGKAEMVDCFAGGLYTAKIEGNDVVVTVPDPFQAGQVLVWAQNEKGLFSMVKLSFIAAAELVVVTPADEIEAIPAAAGDFEIAVTSNVEVEVKVPETADWISAKVTKADYKLVLTLTENETGAPREATISVVRKDNDNEIKSIKIVQLYEAPAPLDPAKAGDILWAEDWSAVPTDKEKSEVEDYSYSSTVVYGGRKVAYSITNSTTSTSKTQLYYDTQYGYKDGEGTAIKDGNLLIAKGEGTFSVTGIPVAEAKAATLTFKANAKRDVVVTSPTENVTVGEMTWGTETTKPYTATVEITFGENVEKLALLFTNKDSNNIRVDDLQLVVAGEEDTNPVHIGTTGYATIAAAVEAAVENDVIEVAEGTFDEHVQLSKAVTLQGAGTDKTFINSVEILKAAATVKDLAINVVADKRQASLAEPQYKNTYGIYVHRAGYGATIDNVVINMENAEASATGIFLVNDPNLEERGTTLDVVKNSTINGVAGKRNAQIYSAYAKLENNTVSSGHKSYCIRIGNTAEGVAGHVELDGNTFKNANGDAQAAVQFNSCTKQDIVLGDNTQDGSFKYLYAASDEWFFAGSGNTINAIYGRAPEIIKKSDKLLTKMWGNYIVDGTWVEPGTDYTSGNAIRNGVITATRVYVTTSNANYPIAAYNRKTGAYVGAITDGFETGGMWLASGISKMEDGTIIVSNMARENSGQTTFKLYKFNVETGSVTKIAELELGTGLRLGDKISTYGTWAAGSIFTTNYFVNSEGKHVLYEWRVKNGVVSDPYTVAMNDSYGDANFSHMASFYQYSGPATPNGGERFGLYAGGKCCNGRIGWPGADSQDLYGGYWYSHNGDGVTQILETSVNDPHWFWKGDDKYMAYVSCQNPGQPNSGYLRFLKMPEGDTAAKKFEAIGSLSNLDTISEKYPASGNQFTDTGKANADANGYCDYVNVDGTIYILAGVVGAGMTVFQVN